MEAIGLVSELSGATLGSALALIGGPLGAGLLFASGRRVRVRVRAGRPPRRSSLHRLVPRSLSFLGIAVAMSSGSAVAATRAPVSPRPNASDAAPPWSEAGGFPPPRPLARTGTAPSQSERAAGRHPVLHAGAPSQEPAGSIPLFPRARREPQIGRAHV